ncbi:hypothetical protein AALO_G00293460 [Alosa alosa]|uniref:Uncharacterized protein n=1 Tax=Alosa alosa TaxID=278164 RepID=A0AAV6FHD8_9TELE|nr:uncharacterized protein LOC125288763 [Alosa alosa]KAG5262214.1 hypothetical protein AALO_G00293460 [Alosa alosa]
MDSPGCFMAALRATFASIRRRIQERGVRQRQRNYRVSKIQTIEKVEQKRDRRLNKRVTPEVLQPSAHTPKRDPRRARLVASGWRPRQENGEALKSQAQEKMDTTLQAFQGRRKPLRVQRRAPQVQVKNRGDTNVNPLSCIALAGKKACSQRWQDVVLEGILVSQDNIGKSCVPLNGKKACSQRWQAMVLENLRLAGQEELPVPLDTSTDSTSSVLGEGGNDHQTEEVKAEDQEQPGARGGDLLDQAETHRDTFSPRWLEPIWLGPEWAKRKMPLFSAVGQ